MPVEAQAAPTYAEVMHIAREAFPDLKSRFGIKNTRLKRLATGGILWEILGAASAQQADALSASLREVFPEGRGVRISRPVRKAELRFTGFDESVAPREIAEAISQYGVGCDALDVRVGEIRSSRDGFSTVWVQIPAVVGLPIAEEGRLRLGWATARAVLLKGRPLRCYRCLAPGHVQQRCPCPIDRARCCFNCGESSHAAAYCRIKPHCPSCALRGRRADHKIGGAGCAPVNPRRGPPSPPPPAVSRAGKGATHRGRGRKCGR